MLHMFLSLKRTPSLCQLQEPFLQALHHQMASFEPYLSFPLSSVISTSYLRRPLIPRASTYPIFPLPERFERVRAATQIPGFARPWKALRVLIDPLSGTRLMQIDCTEEGYLVALSQLSVPETRTLSSWTGNWQPVSQVIDLLWACEWVWSFETELWWEGGVDIELDGEN